MRSKFKKLIVVIVFILLFILIDRGSKYSNSSSQGTSDENVSNKGFSVGSDSSKFNDNIWNKGFSAGSDSGEFNDDIWNKEFSAGSDSNKLNKDSSNKEFSAGSDSNKLNKDSSNKGFSDRNDSNSSISNQNRLNFSEAKSEVKLILLDLKKSFEHIDSKENETNRLDFIQEITPYINNLNNFLNDPVYKKVIENDYLIKYMCDLSIKTYNFIKSTEEVDGNYIDYISDIYLAFTNDVKEKKFKKFECGLAYVYLANILKIICINKENRNIDKKIFIKKYEYFYKRFKKLEETIDSVYGKNPV